MISCVEVFRVPVPFARTFVLGSGPVEGDVIFVKITTDDGVVGWGEQRALPSWSYETAETIALVIERYLAPLLLELTPFDVELFHQRAGKRLSPAVSNGFPFARAAVDIAMHDAAGKIAGMPVNALLGGRVRDEIALCSAIGVDRPEVVAARVEESADYHAYKVKISGEVDADAQSIVAAAAKAGGKPIWLDANQSYRPTALRQLLRTCADIETIFCVEQPVPGTDWAGMRRTREIIDPPVAIDEGCFTAADLARTATLHAADLVVIKTCKSGGLRNALRTAAVAQAHGLEILASGLTDCGIGFAAALHVFSLLETALPAELNGPELLAESYVDGLVINKAVATVPTGPGLGVEVDEERIRHQARPVM
jgi:muconate cycloisomerase